MMVDCTKIGVMGRIALVLSLAGCGGGGLNDAPVRFLVTGTVALDGAPVESGEVLFMPANGSDRPDAGKIENGQYSLEVTAGEKKVEITATKEIPAKDPGGIPDYESIIPSRYNNETELTATVEPSPDNKIDFELQSK